MSTSVVLLAYKEAENLKILLPQIHKVMEKLKDDYEVIVIDSAKPLDNTKEVCEKNNTLYYPQEEPGYAGAFRTGIKYVTKKTNVSIRCRWFSQSEKYCRYQQNV